MSYRNSELSLKHRSASTRRRGQALLLAVLILVFAALLGTTFIAVVAINIGQTSRSEERDKAKMAAQAGLDYANMQLTYGTQGDQWRPEQEVKRYDGINLGAPAIDAIGTKDVDYDAYWTSFDQAQGWARGNAVASGTFVKYPDPRSVNVNYNAPNYMVKVETVLSTDADNASGDKTGAKRITTIGFSTDDPNVFHKVVAYKGGPQQSPGFGVMRTVTNWDYANQTVPSALTNGTGSSSASMSLRSVSGTFPTGNFYVIVGDPTSNNVRGMAVSSYSGTIFTLTGNQTWADGERVELAAGIGVPASMDFDNDSGTSATAVDYKVSNTTTPGSMRINGGLFLMGSVFSNNLRSPRVATSATPAGNIRVTGLVARDVSTQNLTIGGTTTYKATSSNGTLAANQTLLLDSDTASFPGAWKDTANINLSAKEKDELFSDGWNRIAGNSETERQEKPFTPPDIRAGGNGLGRYRQLTRYSTSTDSANPQGAAYGYGEGIYINNPQDKERVGNGTGAFRDMTQAELRNLWYATSTAQVYYRLGTPSASNINTKSLEEMHLRGWVGPDEFRGRGPLVEINSNDTITITLDARADNSTTDLTRASGPVAEKAWRTTAGDLMGNTTLGGVYQQTFSWPSNGVIFAEGNVRIRGTGTNPPRSLTVVSMNNIYIEGSLSTGNTTKILLLAKRNVVLNPTRIIGRPDAQTRLSAAAASGATSLSVYNASTFQAGDWIKLDTGSSNDPVACVTAVNTASNTLTLSSSVTAQPIDSIVRTLTDPVNSSGVPYNKQANRLERFTQALLRRVVLPTGTSQIRLAIRHSAERRDGISIQASEVPGNPPTIPKLIEAKLLNKQATGTATDIVLTSDKYLKVSWKEQLAGFTLGTDYYPSPGAPSDLLAGLNPKLSSEAQIRTYWVGETSPRNDQDTSRIDDDLEEDLNQRLFRQVPYWNYDAAVQNSYGTLQSPSFSGPPPYFFLASVGNRYDWGTPSAPDATYFWFKNIANTTYKVPMATSVIMTLNGSNAVTMRNDRRNTGLGTTSGFEEVNQFGFSFTHGAGLSGVQPTTWEDVPTVDQSFYTNGNAFSSGAGDNTYYTLDSRIVSGTAGGNNSLGFRLNPSAASYFDATGSDAKVPFYRLSRIKLENLNQLNASNEFENLDPGYTLTVNAYVYAQEGSWHILPGDFYDASSNSAPEDSEVRGTYVNLPGGGASQDTTNAGKIENLDLNRDNVVSRGESVAVYRFHRYNYQINFTGAIMENRTATVRNTGSLTGEVQDSLDKWATTHTDVDNFPSNVFTNTTMDYGDELNLPSYTFDNTYATGGLDSDAGFRPPASPDLLYQSS